LRYFFQALGRAKLKVMPLLAAGLDDQR